ncbi:hypothetical protein ACHAXT_005369 [Thalassiosira profunda]
MAELADKMNIDEDENDLPTSAEEEEELVERLGKTRIREEPLNDVTMVDKEHVLQLNTSEESTMDDEVPTPEGFFIDSRGDKASPLNDTHTPLPRWPATPPKEAHRPVAISSCPRTHHDHMRRHGRPMFVSSSSGALVPPPIEEAPRHREPSFDDACPASRAASALQALETTNEHLVLTERDNYGEGHPSHGGASSGDISRQETFHTSHQSLHELGRDKKEEPGEPYTSPLRRSDDYMSRANENTTPRVSTIRDDDDVIPPLYRFTPNCLSGRVLTALSKKFVPRSRQHTHGGSALAGFLALLLVTCANYMLGPMRDAAALAVGVSHIPALTLASTVLALGSSVPVGWLFEAPNPMRRRVWKRMGLTRGETQGTSLALFYRVFAFLLLSYALGFSIVDKFGKRNGSDSGGEEEEGGEESATALVGTFFLRLLGGAGLPVTSILATLERIAGDFLGMSQLVSCTGVHAYLELYADESIPALFLRACACVVNHFGKVIYIMFFLVVHLMKLHSLSLIWGVTTEAMEYEENAERRRSAIQKQAMARQSSAGGLVMMGRQDNPGGDGVSAGKKSSASNGSSTKPSKSSLRLKRLGFVGFGGTLGGILGGVIASFAAHILHLSGLLIVAAILLEISANLSIELGRIMQRHWEEQMRYQSCGDLTSLASGDSLADQPTVDSSMRKSVSMGSMKRVASSSGMSSGNLASLAEQHLQQGKRSSNSNLASLAEQQGSSGGGMARANSIGTMPLPSEDKGDLTSQQGADQQTLIDDNSFKQRLLRGITTILRSRLLMAIFTYNALYASTSVLLSFQRAELVANRSTSGATSAISNTAFLAKINTASSVAVFALQASGLGAYIANRCGQRGALALMPIIRLCGVILLGWWHFTSNGKPPDLILFLAIDEFTKVINFAIAKPVRENLWRGLSAEARYEAKPIVDTLANRWGGGSAAFLVSFINRITGLTGLGVRVKENGERTIFGFPPVLLLCMIISAWWTAVSADVGNIRRKIDLELKKQQ